MTPEERDELKKVKMSLEDSLDLVKKLMGYTVEDKERGEIILAGICKYANIKEEQLKLRSKKGGIIFYKKIACYLLFDYGHWTAQRIADRLNFDSTGNVLIHKSKLQWWRANPQYAPMDYIVTTNSIINNLGL